MNSRNARNAVLVIGFAAVVVTIVGAMYTTGSFIMSEYKRMQAAATPDAPETVELIHGFSGVAQSAQALQSVRRIDCNSPSTDRAITAASLNGVVSEINRLVLRAQTLLDAKKELSSKDRGLLAERISLGNSLAAPLKAAATSLESCSGSLGGGGSTKL